MWIDAITFAAVGILVAVCVVSVWFVRRVLLRQHGAQLRPGFATPRINELIVGSAECPALTIRLSDNSQSWRREPTEIPHQTRAFLEPLLQQVPRALFDGAAIGASVRRVVLQFDPKTARTLASGALELMPAREPAGAFRAIARDANTKQIVEHGQILVEANPAAIVGALWNLAAAITAQKFVVDIKASIENL